MTHHFKKANQNIEVQFSTISKIRSSFLIGTHTIVKKLLYNNLIMIYLEAEYSNTIIKNLFIFETNINALNLKLQEIY